MGEEFKKEKLKEVSPPTSGLDLINDQKLAAALILYNHDVILIQDRDSTIRYISPSVERVFGYKPQEVVGKSLFDYIHPDDLVLAKDVLEDSIRSSGKIYRLEYRVKAFNGDWLSTESIGSSHFGDPAINGFVINARDVTERDRAVSELKIANDRFNQIAENIDEVFFLATPRVGILYVNSAFERIWGMPVESLKKNPRAWADFVIKEDLDGFLSFAEENLRKGDGFLYEFRIKKPNNDIRWILVKIVPIKDDEGIISSVVGIASDITEIKKQEERSIELDKLKNKFIQIVSHQMRTPLGVIRWTLEELLGGEFGGDLSQEHQDVLRIVYNSGLSVLSRLDDLILTLDIENKKIRLEKEKTNLRQLIDSLIIELYPFVKLRKIKVTFKVTDDKYLVDIDKNHMKYAIGKIIDNAIRYNNTGGEVNIALEVREGDLYLTISDNGVGIPPNEQNSIFIKFFRAPNATSMSPDASGLGLFIAKNIIELHGGKIWFDSQEGGGSNFYISFPISTDA